MSDIRVDANESLFWEWGQLSRSISLLGGGIVQNDRTIKSEWLKDWESQVNAKRVEFDNLIDRTAQYVKSGSTVK